MTDSNAAKIGCEGQDWASFQADAPSTNGLAFAFVKATEGLTYVNPRHAAQVAHARAAGLVVGHYHFGRPGSMGAQAAYFLAHAGAAPNDVLCLDWEDPGVSSADKDAWLKAVQAAAPGHRVVLYCNRDFWLNREHGGYAADGLWIADPSAPRGAPRIAAPWLIHQYSSAGGLDRDFSPLSPAQFRAWASIQEVDPMAGITKQDIFDAVWATDAVAAPPDAPDIKTNPTWQAQSYLKDIDARVRALQTAEAGQTAALTALAKLIGSGVDTAAVVSAVQQAIAAAVVHVDVDVTGNQS